MASLSTESTPRERLTRLLTLMKRTRRFRWQAVTIAVVGLAVALAVALHTKRAYRSETTVLYREGMQTHEGESAAARAARLGPKLKDLLYARPKLEQVVREFDLFPEKSRRSMLDAIEEMQIAVGFHARASDSYVIAFTYEDPFIARDVARRLAELMIEEYNRQNLDTATLTRDFLRRKQAEADKGVDDASHALAEFLAAHPQFQWGVNDSPYAPAPATTAPGPLPARAAHSRPTTPADPALAELERSLARVEFELGVPAAALHPAVPNAPTGPLAEVQRQRDAAAAALAAAESALAEKLLSVKPAHPDAVSATARVTAARAALAAADAALARARGGVGTLAEHPGVSLTPARRAELEAQRATLRRQIEARRAALPKAAGVSPAPEAAHADATERSVVELETEWHRLRLELDRAREKLHTIQQTARAADLSADAVARQGHEEMQIFEPAYLPTKPDRGHGRVFFIGATLALFAALGYAALRVLLDDTLLDEGDIAALGGPHVLVSMPRIPSTGAPPPARAIVPAARPDDDALDAEEIDLAPIVSSEGGASQRGLALYVDREGEHPLVEAVFDDPEVEVIGADLGSDAGARLGPSSPAALAALRVLRHRLEQRRGDGSFVVTVMSPGCGEGKTTLALRLAVTLSEAERARVILVEGHFERPGLARALGLRLPGEAGFSQQLHERMHGRGVAWGVVRIGPSLSLLGEPGETAVHPEAIHSAHLESALAALRRSYEYVVIDGPSVVGSGDANVLEAVSDGVLLLVRAGVTKGAALGRATQQLGDRRVLGVVLNDVVEALDPRLAAQTKPLPT